MSAQERTFFFRDIQRSVQNQLAEMQRAVQEFARAVSEADKHVEAFASDASASLSAVLCRGEARISGLDPARSACCPLGLLTIRGCSDVSLARSNTWRRNRAQRGSLRGSLRSGGRRERIPAARPDHGNARFWAAGRCHRELRAVSRHRGRFVAGGDAATIIIRGLAAAIVVFLAVKGGLAIVSTSEAEPNAYVLFFICLVGAVFSEGVWKWAKTKLDGFLSDDAGKTGSQPGGTASVTASGATSSAATGTVAPHRQPAPPARRINLWASRVMAFFRSLMAFFRSL